MNNILGIFVNPFALIINILIGVWTGIKKTYLDNVDLMDRLGK